MRLIQPDPAAALLGLRAMKTVVSAGGRDPPGRARDDGSRAEGHPAHQPRHRRPAADHGSRARQGLPRRRARQQFVNGMLVTSLADGVPSRETVARIEEFAGALAIATPELTDIRLMAEGHMLLAKLDFLRRGHIKDIFKNQLEQKGPLGLAKSVLTMRGVMEDKALSARYRAWEKLPEGTLGRSLIDFYNKHGFSRAGRARRLPGGGPVPRFLPSAGRLQHRAGGRDPGRLLHRGVQARAAVLYRAVLGDDLQRRRADAADQRRLRDGRAFWASPAWPRACWPRSSAAPR